jgi:tetratricopeptide (TPR) repeat protein
MGCQSTGAHDPYGEADKRPPRFQGATDRPPTPHTLRAMARILTAQGKDDQAAYVLEQLISQHPTYVPAYNDLAELHLRSGDVDEAMAALSEGLRVNPDDATLWNNRGMCFLIRGEFDEALQAFDAAVEASPDHADFHANRATALGMLGRYDESLDAYSKAVPPAQAHYNVAILCDARKDEQRAVQEYAQAQRLGYAPPVRQE